MTGFGRTGRRWGHEHLPFQPDILFGGKGLGGGYVPIGMVAATDAVVEPLRGSRFMYFTFTANDGACAGAAAVLDVIDAEHLVERARLDGRRARRRSSPMRSATTATWSTCAAAGLFRGVELTPSGGSVDRWRWCASASPATCGSTRPAPARSPDAVMIGCPLTISNAELELLVDTLRAAIDAATA